MQITATTKLAGTLIVLYLVAWLDRIAINIALPFMTADLAITPERTGWILSAFFLGYAGFQIPGGLLADRVGPRRVVLGALGWWSAFTVLTGLVVNFPAMLATRFFFGVGEGLFPAAVWKLLGNWFTKKNRGTANALVLSAIALGPALAPLVLAPIIAAYGWRAAFYALGVCGPFVWLLARATVRDFDANRAPSRAEGEGRDKTLEQGNFRDLLKVPTVWALFAIGLVFNITMYGWLNWLPSYLVKARGLDLKSMAYAASAPFLCGTVGCMLAGWVSDRFFRGRRKLLVLACMLIGGFCLYQFRRVDSAAMYMGLQCAAGFFLFMACGATWTLPMVLLPEHLMGVGSGFINTGGQIGGFLANLLIGYYIGFRGGDYAAGFDIMVGAVAFAALIVLIGVREQGRPTATVPVGQPSRIEWETA